jgi:pilus assembly protein CpaB
MWKVKRMNTARIVLLTIAVGDGGIAAYPADGSGNTLPPTASINAARDGVSDPTAIQK